MIKISTSRNRRLAAAVVLLLAAIAFIGLQRWPVLQAASDGVGAEPKGLLYQLDQKPLDPAAWGGDHVGKRLPEYVAGDECLFCHRNDIGPTWQKNAHGITVRQREQAADLNRAISAQPALKEIAAQIEYYLGSRHHLRFLKKHGYGRFALLGTRAVLKTDQPGTARIDQISEAENRAWDESKFGDRCAGCHTTAVDSSKKTFAAVGLDCYTCHGDVDLDHTKDTSLIWLSKKKRSDVLAVTSICAQCHLRGGQSRSTGLPYPNNFVAGDNLFKDYQVDFANADDPNMNAGDRHIWRNVRDIVTGGSQSPTCISCHQVHGGQASFKHRRLLRSAICVECHNPEGTLKVVKPYTVKSALCEY